jgi:hypothetical protein
MINIKRTDKDAFVGGITMGPLLVTAIVENENKQLAMIVKWNLNINGYSGADVIALTPYHYWKKGDYIPKLNLENVRLYKGTLTISNDL